MLRSGHPAASEDWEHQQLLRASAVHTLAEGSSVSCIEFSQIQPTFINLFSAQSHSRKVLEGLWVRAGQLAWTSGLHLELKCLVLLVLTMVVTLEMAHSGHCIGCCSCCCDQTPDRSNLRGLSLLLDWEDGLLVVAGRACS